MNDSEIPIATSDSSAMTRRRAPSRRKAAPRGKVRPDRAVRRAAQASSPPACQGPTRRRPAGPPADARQEGHRGAGASGGRFGRRGARDASGLEESFRSLPQDDRPPRRRLEGNGPDPKGAVHRRSADRARRGVGADRPARAQEEIARPVPTPETSRRSHRRLRRGERVETTPLGGHDRRLCRSGRPAFRGVARNGAASPFDGRPRRPRPAPPEADEQPAPARRRRAPGRREHGPPRPRVAQDGGRGRLPLALPRRGRSEPDRRGARRRARAHPDAGAPRRAAARRRAPVLHARLRLRLHALPRRDAPPLAAGSPPRGRGPRRPPLPAAGRLRHVHRHRAGRARPASGVGRDRAGGLSAPPADPAASRRSSTARRADALEADDARATRTGSTAAPRFPLPTGDVEPLTGRSYQQIAMASRSLHRSQDMGMLQPPGPGRDRRGLGAGGCREGRDEGALRGRRHAPALDRRRSSRPGAPGAGRGAPRPGRGEGDRNAAPRSRRPRSATPSRRSPRCSRTCARRGRSRGDGGRRRADAPRREDRRRRKRRSRPPQASRSTRIAESETACAGESFATTVCVWNAGAQPVDVEAVALESPDGWTVPGRPRRAAPSSRACSSEWKLSATVSGRRAADTPLLSLPPPAGRPLRLDRRDRARSAGEPFQPPPLCRPSHALRVGGASIRLAREVTFRIRDEAVGEIRHRAPGRAAARRRRRSDAARLAAEPLPPRPLRSR